MRRVFSPLAASGMYIPLLFLVALAVAACQPAPAPTSTPITLASPTSERGNPTRGNIVTLAPATPFPTWTPQPLVTLTPLPFVGTPPAFAFTPRPTTTPRPTRLIPTRTPDRSVPPTLQYDATYSSACISLVQAEPTDVIVFRGQPAQVSWAAVEGADGYRVWVFSPSKRFVFDQVVQATTVSIPANVFFGLGPYAWEVMPVKAGDRMCVSLTGIFNVQRAGG